MPIIWQKLGYVYGKRKRTTNQLAAYKKLLTLKPGDVEANRSVGLILYKKKEIKKSISYLEKAMKHFDQDMVLLTSLAEGYILENRFKEAKTLLEKAKTLKPGDIKIRISLIKVNNTLGLDKDAEKESGELAKLDEKIIKKSRTNVSARKRSAAYYFKKGDYKKAQVLYKELSVLTPREPLVFKNLYFIERENKKKKAAAGYLKKYLVFDSTNGEGYKTLGDLYIEQKDTLNALKAYRKAFKINPDTKDLIKPYSTIVLKKKLNKEAIRVLKASIKAGSAGSNAYRIVGDLQKKSGLYVAAIKSYDEAIKRDTKNTSLLISQAECYSKKGDIGNAIVVYQQVVMMKPDESRIYKMLGNLYIKKKNGKEAMQNYRKYISSGGKDDKIAKKVGLAEYENKKYSDAKQFLSLVKNVSLHDIKYLFAFGMSCFHTNDFKGTIKHFTLLKKKSVQSSMKKQLYEKLALSYEKTGDKKMAAAAYGSYTNIPGVRNPEASYKMAFLREKFDKKTAVTIYRANTKQFSKDYRNFFRLGILLSENGKTLSQSVSALSAASVLVDTIPLVWQKLGELYGTLKKVNKELAALEKLLVLEPQNLNALKRAGEILLEKNRTKEALVKLEMALTLAPKDLNLIVNCSEGYLRTGRQSNAINLLEKAKSLSKSAENIQLQLFKLYKETKKPKKAEKEIKQLVSDTKKIKYIIIYSNELCLQARYDEAEPLIKKIRKREPANLKGIMLLGKIQKARKEYNEAIETYKMALYIDEKYAPALLERAEVYLLQNKLDRAESYFKKALAANPKLGLAEFGLAQVAKKSNNKAAYAKHLKNAKKLSPKNKMINEEFKKINQ